MADAATARTRVRPDPPHPWPTAGRTPPLRGCRPKASLVAGTAGRPGRLSRCTRRESRARHTDLNGFLPT